MQKHVGQWHDKELRGSFSWQKLESKKSLSKNNKKHEASTQKLNQSTTKSKVQIRSNTKPET